MLRDITEMGREVPEVWRVEYIPRVNSTEVKIQNRYWESPRHQVNRSTLYDEQDGTISELIG